MLSKQIKLKKMAIDLIRAIKAWADWQEESFNKKIKTVSHWEKLYKYAQDNNLEFLDYESFVNSDLTDEEILKHKKNINKILGYKIY